MAARASGILTRRQQQIVDFVLAEGSANILQLAERLGVSQMTAYRDADRLAELGVVRRVRGGITAQPSRSSRAASSTVPICSARRRKRSRVRALELIEPGMSVIVDDGTTLLPLVRELGSRAPLTVMTTFVPAIAELAQMQDINLVVLGGSYRRHYDSLGGVLCADMISQIRADLLFLSPSAIHGGTALHQEEDMVATKRAMMLSSDRRILVADHSKLGRRATHRLASDRGVRGRYHRRGGGSGCTVAHRGPGDACHARSRGRINAPDSIQSRGERPEIPLRRSRGPQPGSVRSASGGETARSSAGRSLRLASTVAGQVPIRPFRRMRFLRTDTEVTVNGNRPTGELMITMLLRGLAEASMGDALLIGTFVRMR